MSVLADKREPGVRITFPAHKAHLGALSYCYVMGCVTPPLPTINVNGSEKEVWHTGSFVFMHAVTPGLNRLRIVAGESVLEHTFHIAPPVAAKPLDAIKALAPLGALGISVGEEVELVCEAPAGKDIFVNVGERDLKLLAANDAPTRYSRKLSFDQGVNAVPITFYGEGLQDVRAGAVTVAREWPAYQVTGPLFETRAFSAPGGGATLAFLSAEPLSVLPGAGYAGEYQRVRINDDIGYVNRRYLKELDANQTKSARFALPDIASGFAARPAPGGKPQDILVALDPGHGGNDSGALGPSGLTEKEVNLAYSLKIRDLLQQAGFRVLMTREKDVTLGLYERVRIAYRAKADLFISVHHNATAAHTDPRRVRHLSTYAWHERGLALARVLHPHIAAVTPIADRGVMVGNFAVCRNPAIPSCLLELDFINCPAGEEAIQNPAQQKRVAEALVKGVSQWVHLDSTP